MVHMQLVDPAQQVKTDRRDALLLARMHRSAELVKIAIQIRPMKPCVI
jgi:hypothetical protein